MSFFTIFPNQLSQWCPFAYFKEIFSREECEKIIALFENPIQAKVGEGEGGNNSEIRTSEVCFIPYSQDTDWIFQRLLSFAAPVNQARWGFQLSGFFEGLQLTKYSPGGHYDWHMDIGGLEQSRRKLSLVVQLSNPDDYTGGELKFAGLEKDPTPKSRGDLIAFPSYVAHKVFPIESGTRYSLVAWISGEPYR